MMTDTVVFRTTIQYTVVLSLPFPSLTPALVAYSAPFEDLAAWQGCVLT